MKKGFSKLHKKKKKKTLFSLIKTTSITLGITISIKCLGFSTIDYFQTNKTFKTLVYHGR